MRSAPAHTDPQRTLPPWVTFLLLALTVVIQTAGNVAWIRANVVLVGRDASGYLLESLEYYRTLDHLSLRTLFQAFTLPEYRTPALYIAAQPFLWLFGPDMDGAQLLNVALFALLIPITWLLARSVSGEWPALLAALLVGLLPMNTAMARLFYTEIFLTVTVALTLLALSRSRDFAHFGWSLLFGVSLGVGLLVKWTMPIYLAMPLLWIIWRGRKQLARGWGTGLRVAALALLPALAFALLWYWPNRDLAALYLLGPWLLPGWFVLAYATSFFLLGKRTPARNLAAGLAFGALIASLWYLPHINFARSLLSADVERGSDPLGLFSLIKYTRYFDYLYTYHFGALAFWLIVPVALLPWLRALVQRRALKPRAGLLWLSMLSAWLVLVLLSQRNARNLSPLLPQITILLALGIAAYPRTLRTLAAALAVLVLALQWLFFSVDATWPLYARTQELWAAPDYSTAPAIGRTDPAFWVAPQILKRIAEGETVPQSLGNLVNADYLHRGSLKYLIGVDSLLVTVNDQTEESALWQNLIGSQWVLTKDGINKDVEVEGQGLIERVAAGDALFEQLYRVQGEYPLPNGETVRLYKREAGPGFPDSNPLANAQALAVAEAIRAGWSEPATLLYANGDVATWVGRLDPASERLDVLPSADGAAIAQMEGARGTLFVVLDANQQALAAWLEQNSYKSHEVGGDELWVAVAGRPERALDELATPAGAQWRGQRLATLRAWDLAAPGEVIPLEVGFEGADASLKWSVRLLDARGKQVAAADRTIQVQDRFGLFVPPQTPPGRYTVAALVYDAVSLEPLPAPDGRESVNLFAIEIDR